MAKTALKIKQSRRSKFGVCAYTRRKRCGRPRSVYRKFSLCCVCLYDLAHTGQLPGVTRSSRRPGAP